MGLSLDFIKTCRVPGKWRDEENLYLVIPPRNPAGGTWQLLYSLGGKARAMGLGSRVGKNAPGRDAVREAARDARKLLRQGLDPLAERAAGTRAEVAQGTSFTSAAERYIAAHEAGWRNRKHSQQWRNTLAAYVHPVLGKLPVGAISTDDVMRVLEPLWTRLPATASRVRSRIEAVLDYAKARGWRDGENVARWRGHLALLLPARGKVRAVQHHPALDWRLAPAFMAKLRAEPGIAARALEFLILTAARSGEGRGAAWAEIDASEAAWMVPAGRMKRRRTHRVPLSAAALAVLARVQDTRRLGALVFQGQRPGRPVSEFALGCLLRKLGHDGTTVHGFRSTLHDWAAEATSHPNIVVSQALAHAVGDKVEAAYRRGDLFEKRRALMEDWAAYLATAPAPAAALPSSAEKAMAAE